MSSSRKPVGELEEKNAGFQGNHLPRSHRKIPIETLSRGLMKNEYCGFEIDSSTLVVPSED